MKIKFLGSGGGRFSTITQRRMTGGFRLDDLNGKNYHIDPGPGALVRTYEFGLNPKNLSGIFVSHSHTDHYTDGEILIEAITRGMRKEKGIIIGSESVLNGFEHFGPSISNYHKSKSENILLRPGDIRNFDDNIIKGTKTIHGDPTGIGFQIDCGDIKISYTSDTEYFDELQDYHEGADILIGNVLRPNDEQIDGHLSSEKFTLLINEIKPKLAIMTHFGLRMVDNDPISQALKITRKTKIKTLAAFDGMSLNINNEKINESKISSLKKNRNRIFKRKRRTNHKKYLLF